MGTKEDNAPDSLLTLLNSRNDDARNVDRILVSILSISKTRGDSATQSVHEEWVEVLCPRSASAIAPKL